MLQSATNPRPTLSHNNAPPNTQQICHITTLMLNIKMNKVCRLPVSTSLKGFHSVTAGLCMTVFASHCPHLQVSSWVTACLSQSPPVTASSGHCMSLTVPTSHSQSVLVSIDHCCSKSCSPPSVREHLFWHSCSNIISGNIALHPQGKNSEGPPRKRRRLQHAPYNNSATRNTKTPA